MSIKLLDRVRTIRGPRKRFEGWVDSIWAISDGTKHLLVVTDDGFGVYFREADLNKIAMPTNLVNYPAARKQLRIIETRLQKSKC